MYPRPRTILLHLLTITVVLGGIRSGVDAQSLPLTAMQAQPPVGARPPFPAAQPPIPLTIQPGQHSRQPAWNSFDKQLTVEQLVEVAIELNPQVRAAKQQWYAAQHQILQNYAPRIRSLPMDIWTATTTSTLESTPTPSRTISSFPEKPYYRRMKQGGPQRLRG